MISRYNSMLNYTFTKGSGRGSARMMSRRRTPTKNSYTSASIPGTPSGLGFDTPPRQYELEG